ncbi:MAG: DUF4037 domain-containing protein [Christensenellales bacterium]
MNVKLKGLELSRAYYEEYGKPMIENGFAEYKDRIAVGLVGHGSECFGFDDEISRDHDFEPGFCLWITEEDERKFGFRLFRAYSALPKEYMGIKVQDNSAFGSDFKGVHTIKEFYSFYTGSGNVPESLSEWLSIPDFYLAEAVNGEVFSDPLGEFSAIREGLKNCPEDVRKKKLASAVFGMAQSGQYNYYRCLSHGEKGAAALALAEFAKNTAHAVYLFNKTYMPYYKWAFKGIRTQKKLSFMADELEKLLAEPYNGERNRPIIESIARIVADEIRAEGLSERTEEYLEPYAYCIKNNIKDAVLRTSSVME